MRWLSSIVLTVVILVVSSSQCESEIYKWVDKNGKTHFTDNPVNIPKASSVETRKELSAPTLKSGKPQQEKVPLNKSQSKQGEKDSIFLKNTRKQSRNISPSATVSAMLSATVAGNWEKYVDEFYGEQHKFRSTLDRDGLVLRFREKWGNKVIVALKEASQVKPKLSGDKAIFQLKNGDFILYKNAQGNWMFHL